MEGTAMDSWMGSCVVINTSKRKKGRGRDVGIGNMAYT